MQPIRAVRTRTPLLTAAAMTAAVVGLTAAASPRATSPRANLPGMTYTMRSSAAPVGDGPGAAAMRASLANYTGVVVFAAGRGRMDITEGSQPQMFEQGDYVLFDSSDYIIVRPSEKHFFTMPTEAIGAASNAMEATGMKMSAKNVTVSLDTLGPGDPLDGLATQHYRINQAYTMVIDMSGLGMDLGGMTPPPMDAKTTMEYWYADVPEVLPNPFAGMATGMKGGASSPTPAGGMMGFMKEVSDKMEIVQAALPKGKVAVKTVSSMRMSGMMGMGMDMTMEISGIKKIDVDPTQLALPDEFTQIAMPGMEALGSTTPLPADGGAKWRVKPGGGSTPR